MKTGVARAWRVVAGSLVLAAAFEAALFASKETPAVYDHAPWLNDPYDTAVSFALFCLPIMVAPSALRLLAARAAPTAPGRLADLLRACRVITAVVAVTLAACWAALARGANRPAWTSVTAVQVAVLALLTVGTVACAAGIRQATAALRRDSVTGPPAATAPDWVDDLLRAGRLLAGVAGPPGRLVIRLLDWADDRIAPALRCHPIGSAAVLSVTVGLLVATSQSVGEGYGAGVAVVFFCVVTAGVYAFVVTAGWYLRLVRADRPGRPSGPVIHATVLAGAAVPVALAFRASLWSLVGASPQASGLPALCLLLGTAALLAAAATLAAERWARSRRASAASR